MPSIFKIALPALAVAGTAFAADCSTTATATIQNAGDATGLASCSTFSGSIAIATGTTDDIVLNGVKKITGNLIASSNSNMRRVSADSLETIDGDFQLDGLTRLVGVDMPKLKSVDSIKFNALPNLQQLGFTGEINKAGRVDIQNTALRSLKGINIEQVDQVTIANNGYIDEVSMKLGNVSKALDISFNNQNVKVNLPNLIWARNLTFRFCGSVAVPSLQTVNGSFGLYNNGFDSFAASNLTNVGSALVVVANNQLSNITFPQLTKITDNLQIANNSKLIEITGFPQLVSIGGSFDISGNMTDVETPKLNSVSGTFNLQSSGNVTETCATYKSLKDKKLIEGKYTCVGTVVDPGQQGHNPTSQTGGNKASAASSSAVNGALGLAALAAVLLF